MLLAKWKNTDFSGIGRITWPAFVELVLSALFGMVDLIMLGQTPDSATAIAAVGLTNNPMNLFLGVFAAVNVGTTTAVAWQIGAGRPDKARDIARHSLLLNLGLGLLVSSIGFFFASDIVTFMGADPLTLTPGTHYMQIVAAGLLPQAINLSVTASLRGVGLTRLPMAYNLLSNALNVVGNYILIYGKLGFPAMGVEGAAISTSLSRLVGCLVALYVLYFRENPVRLPLGARFKFQIGTIRHILQIGTPAAMEQFVLQSGFVLFARTVSGLGTAVFAAHQIGLSICGMTFSPSQAFGVAATTLTGQNLGAGKPEEAHRKAEAVHLLALFCAAFVGLIFILFSHPLAMLYTNDLAVAGMAGTVLKIMAFAQPGQSTQLSLAGALRGAGDTRYPLYASVAGVWVFRVLVATLFVEVFHWGLNGAWFAILLDQYARAGVVYARYRSGLWLKKDLRTF